MAMTQRLLFLSSIPIFALLGLRNLSPVTSRFFRDVLQPYVAGIGLGSIFLIVPPRVETPILMASVSHSSHVDKIAVLALELATLGYPVTFITGKVFEKQI
ncbi:hypothetical protein CC78DRAFT_529275 [Lojkania enalia]|uniref:Uncharacterized protein n=1 Tax=Lojkania enalia TaxID=147567 RepID=A0A9P4NAA0_9PLEO|nr:hypothetical protein CC78DRAFT_529275 [Didymosphaeria enalia]